MKITRIYSDENGDSHFEDVEIELFDKGDIGSLSSPWKAKSTIFRETTGEYDYDFHNAPARQFVVMLDGQVEIETSLGVKRLFVTGDVLLAEDVKGKGHRSKAVDGKSRKSIFIVLDD